LSRSPFRLSDVRSHPLDPPLRVAVVRSVALIIGVGRLWSSAKQLR